jgi:mono/diheme cytochrome c family protein
MEMRVDRAVLVSSIAAVVVGTAFVVAQDRTADQGVYTSAQAARGGTAFEEHCVSCHREGGNAPVLAGERFTKSFADSTLLSVFTTIQTTMPRQAPGSLTESEYMDILAHLLKLNGFPDGMTELTAMGLVDIKVPGKGGASSSRSCTLWDVSHGPGGCGR